jgi:hypothetical protein
MTLDRIQKLRSMTACSIVVISNLHSPSRGHMGERERGELERDAHQVEGIALGLVELCVLLLLLGPPLYSGEGVHLTPPQSTKGGGQGRSKGDGQGCGQAGRPQNPNPSHGRLSNKGAP